eukprot:895103-Rhodomonas_salina.1
MVQTRLSLAQHRAPGQYSVSVPAEHCVCTSRTLHQYQQCTASVPAAHCVSTGDDGVDEECDLGGNNTDGGVAKKRVKRALKLVAVRLDWMAVESVIPGLNV